MNNELTEAEQQLEQEAADAVETLFHVVNKMNSGEKILVKVLGDAMNRQHRTLIQQFWGVIAKVIAEYAATKSGFFDLRNEDSVMWAREVAKIKSYMRYI